ncbi:conserved hypothetical protein [Sinorhizobium medicae]|uniref:Uncharacterized protein n=1 Tax=Sinorhizobium medicae TaxID=110321 RepID=A0A508X2C4_9HYPH|nr:conserved hypothetical protein [Sinorhizobium medicae]
MEPSFLARPGGQFLLLSSSWAASRALFSSPWTLPVVSSEGPSADPAAEPPVPTELLELPPPAEEPPVPMVEAEPPLPDPAAEPPVPTELLDVPPPAEDPPVPSVDAEPDWQSLVPGSQLPPAELPPVPTVLLDVPPPALVPPVPIVVLDCAKAPSVVPASKPAARAVLMKNRIGGSFPQFKVLWLQPCIPTRTSMACSGLGPRTEGALEKSLKAPSDLSPSDARIGPSVNFGCNALATRSFYSLGLFFILEPPRAACVCRSSAFPSLSM